jgi:carbon monoxide dehydrogenase subunit G
MKVSGSYTVPAEKKRAYTSFQDPIVLARCLPGCDWLNKIGDDEYEMKMKLAISSIQGLFAGKIRVTDQNFPESFRLIVEGSGKVGFLKGDGLLTLAANGGATEVRYDGDVQVGGTIAGVGQRLLDTTAKFIIKKFFARFSEAVAGREPQEASPG